MHLVLSILERVTVTYTCTYGVYIYIYIWLILSIEYTCMYHIRIVEYVQVTHTSHMYCTVLYTTHDQNAMKKKPHPSPRKVKKSYQIRFAAACPFFLDLVDVVALAVLVLLSASTPPTPTPSPSPPTLPGGGRGVLKNKLGPCPWPT